MEDRIEVPEYIGFYMKGNKWIEVKEPRHDTYKWMDGGASGYVYINNNRLVKIIRGNIYEDKKEFIKNCKKEADFQKKAARHNLAPAVYYDGFVDIPFFVKDIPFYYYIVMDYLSSDWKQIHPKSNKELMCEFITNLVNKVGIINNFDPYVHFYKNKYTNQLVMIDYGRCIECKKDSCIQQMADALEIDCSKSRNKSRSKSRSRSRSKSRNKSPSKSRSKSPSKTRSKKHSPIIHTKMNNV